jgi:hypothetical protein
MGSHLKTLLLSPGPYLAAALPAGRGPGPDPAASMVDPPGMLDKRREPTAKVVRMLGAQIKLVRRAFQHELNRLVGRTAGQVILQLHLEPLHYLPPKSGWPGQKFNRRRAPFIPRPQAFHCWRQQARILLHDAVKHGPGLGQFSRWCRRRRAGGDLG